MTRTREIFRSQWMYLWLTIALALASFTPVVSHTRVLADSSAPTPPFDSVQALPSWYRSTPASRVDALDSYRALPTWWSPAAVAATAPTTPTVKMAATGVVSFAITVPETATAGVPFPTEIQALDGDGIPVSVAATVTLTTNSGHSITPENAELIAGVATPDVTLTKAGTDRLVKVISGTAAGQATITVFPAPAYSLTLSPADETITAGETQDYDATAFDNYNNLIGDVTESTKFSIDAAAGGAWLGNEYTSEYAEIWTVTGTYTNTEDQQVHGTTSLTVDPGPATTLAVTPDSAVVQVGRTRTFTATGTDAFGNPTSVAPLWTTNWGTVNPAQNYYTIFTADTEAAAGKLVTATENGVSANAVVDIVHGPFDHFGITPDPIGTRTAGTPFALTVEAQDEYGNRVLTFDAAVDLDDSTGTITEDTISLDDGIGTTSIAITRAGTGIVISATAGVTTTATDGFPVVPNDLHHIRVNNVANNGGASFGGPVEMGSRTIDIYGHIDAWAGGYDKYDNYREDVSVTWDGTDLVGQGEFIPTSGVSTTFAPAPVLSGNGTIRAVNAVPPAEDESGQINIQAPKLAIAKSGPGDPVPAGSVFLYRIDYSNVGNAIARGVRITETYDPRVTFVDASPQPDVPPNVWTPGDVPPGASDSIVLAVQVDNSLVPSTVLTNVVMIGGLRLEQDIFTETTRITSTPGLTMTLDANPQPAEAGGTLVYQIHYENKLDGGTAPVSGVRVTMTYDARVTFHSFTSDDPEVVQETDNVWVVGELQAGEEGNINVTVDVDAYMEDQTQLVTSATIKSAETLAFTDVELTLVDAPALALIKMAAPSPVEADAQLVYTLVYSNAGHLDTTALSITDAVPANTDYVSCQPSSICSRIGDIVVWEPGSLAPGAKRTATMVVNVRRNLDSGTVLTNTARAHVINEETYSATAQITTTVLGQPSLWLSIGNGADEVEAGDALEYTLHYSNTGNANAYSTTIVVTPPSSQYVEDVDCEPSAACDIDDGQLVYDLGTVPGGVTSTVRMVASVKHPLPAGADRIVALASINTPTPGDPPEGNDAADEDTIATRPDLVVLVDYEDQMPWPGKRVTYTLNYVNIGHIATDDVWITVTSNPNTEFRGKTSSPGWIAEGDGRYSYYVGGMGYPDGGELLFVVTLTNTTFTTSTPDFDATFEIGDSGVSGEDANPSNNRYHAELGVPDIVIEKVTVEPSVWRGEAGLLKATLRNVGTGKACGIYNPIGCVGFVLDPYLDPDTPPSSYPIDGFGDCFIEVFPIEPGIARTVEISFTTLPRSKWPAYESGLCEASALNEIWLKVDNWDPTVAPYPDGSGWVPESNEYNNVYGPVAPETQLFLPLIMRSFTVP